MACKRRRARNIEICLGAGLVIDRAWEVVASRSRLATQTRVEGAMLGAQDVTVPRRLLRGLPRHTDKRQGHAKHAMQGRRETARKSQLGSIELQ